MMVIEKSISEFLEQVAIKHGQGYRNRLEIRHAGDGQMVITMPEGNKNIVSLGHLQLLTVAMKQHSAFQHIL